MTCNGICNIVWHYLHVMDMVNVLFKHILFTDTCVYTYTVKKDQVWQGCDNALSVHILQNDMDMV